MKILCLGAAGKISRESAYDLVEYSNFKKITIADYNEDAGLEVVKWLDAPRHYKPDDPARGGSVGNSGHDPYQPRCIPTGGLFTGNCRDHTRGVRSRTAFPRGL